MLGKSSELILTAHAFLEPLALSNLLSEKLTPIDLGFDKRLSTVYELSRAAYRSRVGLAFATSDRLDFDPLDVDSIQRGGAAPDELLDEAFRAALTYTAGVMAKLNPTSDGHEAL
jgi:hypothetical protein